jgi:diguanylate cyclase (GGDEF)-like protein/PAS domain S-box-containing protein
VPEVRVPESLEAGAGRPMGAMMVHEDSGSRRQRLGALAAVGPDMLVVCDDDGRLLEVNETLEACFGFCREELLGRSIFDFFHPDDVDYMLSSLAERLGNEGPGLPVEIRIIGRDGEARLCEVVGQDLRHVPEVGGLVGSIRDISRRPALADSPVRLRSMVHSASDITLLVGASGEVLFASHALTRLLGGDPDGVVGSDWLALFHPDDRTEAREVLSWIRDPAHRERTWRARLVHRSGLERTFDLKADDQLDDPVVAGVLVSARDLTELEAAETRFEDMFEDAPIGMVLLGAEGRVLRANDAFGVLVGRSGDLTGEKAEALVGTDCAIAARDQVDAQEAGEARRPVELELVRSDGSRTWISLIVSKVRRSADESHVMAQLEDISDRRERERLLREQNELLSLRAHFDVVTGLPNRLGFEQVLDAAVARNRRHAGGLAVLFCDLDGFKEVNDRTGHAAGDRVLAVVADRLRGAVRAEDLVARHGGDEFVVVCEGLVDDEGLQVLAHRIVDGVGAPMALGGLTSDVGISVGIARCVHPDGTALDLMALADRAMYEAKAAGDGVPVLLDLVP